MQALSTTTNKVLILNEAEVRRCLPISLAIRANSFALKSLARKNNNDSGGGAMVPPRISLPYHPPPPPTDKHHPNQKDAPEDCTLFKPAAYYNHPRNTPPPVDNNDDDGMEDVMMGMKIVSVRANNPSKYKLPTVPATVTLLDPETGLLTAVMGGTYLTAARTAAGSALATQLCLSGRRQWNDENDEDKALMISHLVVFGAGLQGEQHIAALQCIAQIHQITIVNRTKERADILRQTILDQSHANHNTPPIITINVILLNDNQAVKSAVQSAHVIVTATNSSTALFDGEWVTSGCHVNGVGSYTPQMKEVDTTFVNRCGIIYIDTTEAMHVGDLHHLLPLWNNRKNKDRSEEEGESDGGVVIDLLGDALSENALLWNDTQHGQTLDCTFYKSVGTAIQDVVTAQAVLKTARELQLGTLVDM